MNNYQHFDSLLQGRNHESRKLANNTYLIRHADDSIAVKLHDTDVVTYYRDGTVLLDSGGWDTPTTFDRIQEYAPGERTIRMGTTKRIPYICIHQDTDDSYWGASNTYRWQGSMTLRQADDGTLTIVSDVMAQEQEKLIGEYHKHLEKLIKRYIKPLNASLTWELLNDMGGDCWYCTMGWKKDGDTSGKEQVLGDAMGNVSHLYEHLTEEYRMGSLIRNAYHARHYTDVALQMDCYQGNERYGSTERIQDCVRKYFRDKLYNNLDVAMRFDEERKELAR